MDRTTPRPSARRRWLAGAGVVGGVALLLGLAVPGAAAAAPELQPECVRGEARSVTCTYATAGSNTVFTVPAGVTSLQVSARGASGANGGALSRGLGGIGGLGAQVSDTIEVVPGASLGVAVGARGTGTTGGAGFGRGGDGANGNATGIGQPGTFGGGGGGGSAVLVADTPAVVAAGGGGGGGTANAFTTALAPIGPGGAGGNHDEAGQPGGPVPGTPGQPGAQPGSAGGPGVTSAGDASGGGAGGGGGLNGGSGSITAAAARNGAPGGGGGTSLGSAVATAPAPGDGQVVITYTETLAAGAIAATSGGGQETETGTAFPAPLIATVTDSVDPTTPVPGAEVTFTVTSGSASFPGGSATASVDSDDQGRATSPSLAAGLDAGPVTVSATTPGAGTPATFALEVTPATPATVTAVSGGGQSAEAGAAFPQPLVAEVRGTSGRPLPNNEVTFTVTSGSASFGGSPSAAAPTSADGRATSPTLTAGSTPGPVTVTAATPGTATTATYQLTVTAPPRPPAPTGTRVVGAAQFRAGAQTINLSIDVTGTANSASGRCAVSGGGFTATCTKITSVVRGSGSNADTATAIGTARGSDGRISAFRVIVTDRANPNGAGRDQISLTAQGRTASGTVSNGNLAIS